jgi:hypothetical protein
MEQYVGNQFQEVNSKNSLSLYAQTEWGNGYNPQAHLIDKSPYYRIPPKAPRGMKMFGYNDIPNNERNASQSSFVIIHGKADAIDTLAARYNVIMDFDTYQHNADNLIDMPMYLISISGDRFLKNIDMRTANANRFESNRTLVAEAILNEIPEDKKIEFERWYQHVLAAAPESIPGVRDVKYGKNNMLYSLAMSIAGRESSYDQKSESGNAFLLDMRKIYIDNPDHKFIITVNLPTGLLVSGRRIIYRYWDCLIALPGGKAKFIKGPHGWIGESLIDACVRELYEELRLNISRYQLKYLSKYGDSFLFDLCLDMVDVNVYLEV